MSEQVRQRQVTLNERKTLVITKGVYGSKFGNETHFLSFAAIVAPMDMDSTANDANQLVARHINSGSHSISDMNIRKTRNFYLDCQ